MDGIKPKANTGKDLTDREVVTELKARIDKIYPDKFIYGHAITRPLYELMKYIIPIAEKSFQKQ